MAKQTKIQYFKTYLKNIIVPFEEYFPDKNASDYDEFFMSIAVKKTYAKIADLIVKENNILLNSIGTDLADRFIITYFSIKYSIDRGEYDKKINNTFINDIISLLFPIDFMTALKKFIEENYETDVDEKMDPYNNIENIKKFLNDKNVEFEETATDEEIIKITKESGFKPGHKYDKGTTFLDRHYKILYLVSSMSRLIIPLITHYIYNQKNMVDINKFIMNVFISLFNVTQVGTNSDVLAKLKLFTERAVNRTKYTDSVMWDRLKILGTTPETVSEETLIKLVTNVIPKYSFDRNIMNLNTVVIRKSVMSYTLRKKDPYTLFSLSSNEGKSTDDDSILSEVEIFDSYNTQRDESIILFREHGTSHDIDIIMIREGVTVSQEEIDFYKNTGLKQHDFLKTAVCHTFSHYFSGIENIIGGCRKEDWIRLVIILKKMLERIGLNYFSEFISAHKHEYSYKRLSKYIDTMINEDPLYKEIIEKKYQSVQGIFEKRNFIKNMIISIFNNTYSYNSYNNPRNGQYIEKEEERIVKEVLNFFNSFVV